MKFMRIVSMSFGGFGIQTADNKNGPWEQTYMSADVFEEFMWEHFPKQMNEFMCSEPKDYCTDILHFFYHYGETPKMIRTGESYIFEKEAVEK